MPSIRRLCRRALPLLATLMACAAPLRAANTAPCASAGSPPAYVMGPISVEGIHYPGVPTEPCIAVGPAHILCLGPGDVRVFDKATGQMLRSQCQNVFFQTSTACLTGANPVYGDGGGLIDPDLYFDRVAQRFVAVSFSVLGTGSRHVKSHLHLAVSSTSNPLDPWYVYHMTTTTSPLAPGFTMVPDRPSLGVSLDKIALASHMFSYDGGPEYTLFRVVDRDSAYAHLVPDGVHPDSINYYDLVDPDTMALNYRLGRNTTADPVLHALSIGGIVRPAADYRSITGPARACVLSDSSLYPLNFPTSYVSGWRAPQASSATPLLNELDSLPDPGPLWVRGHTLSLAWHQPGLLCGPDTLDLLHVLRLVAKPLPAGGLAPHALMDTLYGDSGRWYAFPAVCDDSLGRVYLGFQASSPTMYPSCFVTGMLPTDATIERNPTLVKAGEKAWTRSDGGGHVGRWGDFSTIDLDESVSPPMAYYVGEWTKAGTATTIDTLGTWIRNFSFPQTVGVQPGAGSPVAPNLALENAWPNPTSGGARIRFALQRPARVRLEVEDVSGRRVRVLVDGEFAAGAHQVLWDGREASGNAAPAGVYVLRASDGATTRQAKLALVR